MKTQGLISRTRLSLVFLCLVAVLIAVMPVSTRAQRAAAARSPATPGQVPRTVDGHPDLQGVWSFASLTPLERPDELAGKTVLTEKEAIDYGQTLVRALDHDTPDGAERLCKGTGNYNEFWYDRGALIKTRRTSLIVDPSNGKIPPLTAEGEKRRDLRAAARRARGPADSWEDRSLGERCIVGFNAGPPMMPGAYNNNVQLFQTSDSFVILNEMVHDARIVPLNGRPHNSSRVRQWAGDSRGHWEGDAMVVETVNFDERNTFRGASPQLRLIERFTRVDAGTVLYEFTVDDPMTFTKPWTVQVPMSPVKGQLYEYACHEGNYGLLGILAGTRAEEKKAAEANQTKR
jgi:hypothetical protein